MGAQPAPHFCCHMCGWRGRFEAGPSVETGSVGEGTSSCKSGARGAQPVLQVPQGFTQKPNSSSGGGGWSQVRLLEAGQGAGPDLTPTHTTPHPGGHRLSDRAPPPTHTPTHPHTHPGGHRLSDRAPPGAHPFCNSHRGSASSWKGTPPSFLLGRVGGPWEIGGAEVGRRPWRES